MKQRNVQQQNAQILSALRAKAAYWRRHPLPLALHALAGEKGIDLARAIILHLEIDFPGMPNVAGTLLTADGRFINFELDADRTHRDIVEVHEWQDVSAAQNMSEHNPGIGVGDGALALRVLREANAGGLPGI